METSKQFLTSIKEAKQSVYKQAVAMLAVCVGVVTIWISFIY